MKHIHRVLGVMAGSSMDGLDVCLVEFASRQGQWYFETKWAKTIKYPPSIYGALKEWAKLSVEDQKRVNGEFARWCSKAIDENVPSIPFDLVGYHGHTVLHDPSRKISWQLGNGQIIANDLNTPTIADFRSLDVELGGQGAPLVPMGDFELF
ncbi:MAG: anhydro-N-acetylmuramic acid kinase, partial [Bacteroidota bacterium]